MAKNAHLTYDDRLTIQSSLADRLSFKAIGLILGKDPSTIAKEVKGHLSPSSSMQMVNVGRTYFTAILSVPIRREVSK